MSRDQYRALLDLALVDGREYAVDVVEWVRFDERFDLDLAVEHEVERRRVRLGGQPQLPIARASYAIRLDSRSSTLSIVKPTTDSVAP